MSFHLYNVTTKMRHLLAQRRRLLPSRCCCTLLLLGIITTLLVDSTYGIRAKRNFFANMNDDDDESNIRTEYVDRNNQTILAMFNLTRDQLSRIAADKFADKKEDGAPARDSHFFEDIKELRINDIRNRLHRAFQGGTSEESQEHPLHEMAAYPICNSETNESSWLHDNNVTIRFSDSLFEPKRDNLNLDSAILRLYKVNPNGLSSTDETNAAPFESSPQKLKRCADPLLDAQIRVTVSTVQQLRRNKRERKKRICNTVMMNVSHTGWVEIDIRRAIQIWERNTPMTTQERQQLQQQQQQQQLHHLQPQPGGRQPILVGWLMIEVHDEEERPLKPGLFFKPPKCDQADLAIPWNYYGPHAAMPSTPADEVPRSPRIDVKLIGYASFAPKKVVSRQLHNQLHLNLRRQLYRSQSHSVEDENEESAEMEKMENESGEMEKIENQSTTSADGLVDASASTVYMLRHRKRHAHSHHGENSREQHQEHQQHQQHQHQHQHQQEEESKNSENSDEQAQYSSSTQEPVRSVDQHLQQLAALRRQLRRLHRRHPQQQQQQHHEQQQNHEQQHQVQQQHHHHHQQQHQHHHQQQQQQHEQLSREKIEQQQDSVESSRRTQRGVVFDC